MSCDDAAGIDAEEFGEFLDSWAQLWEQEFERFSTAEDSRLSRVAEKARQLAAHGLHSYQETVEARVLEEDARARQIARVAGVVLEAQQTHAVEEVNLDAAQGRRQVYQDALHSMDDLVRNVSDGAAARRQAREAKRREEKRVREAAAEARRRQRDAEPQDGSRGRGPASGSGGGGGAAERGTSAPPRFTRQPGAHAAGLPAAPPPRLDSFAAFDAAWGIFERQVAAALSQGGAVRFDDVPWPTLLPSVAGICPGDGAQAQKDKLRTAVLRWHPDKWGKVLGLVCEDHRARVMDGVKCVTQRLLEERKRLGR